MSSHPRGNIRHIEEYFRQRPSGKWGAKGAPTSHTTVRTDRYTAVQVSLIHRSISNQCPSRLSDIVFRPFSVNQLLE